MELHEYLIQDINSVDDEVDALFITNEDSIYLGKHYKFIFNLKDLNKIYQMSKNYVKSEPSFESEFKNRDNFWEDYAAIVYVPSEEALFVNDVDKDTYKQLKRNKSAEFRKDTSIDDFISYAKIPKHVLHRK